MRGLLLFGDKHKDVVSVYLNCFFSGEEGTFRGGRT